jgi:glutamate-1-semialdehyde 2,1-aminomutase
VGGTPRFIKSAKGAYLTDVDDNSYIDFVGSWGPTILGHGAPAVLKAVKKALTHGISFGASTEAEIQLAAIIKEAYPSIELVRLTNSGTEATMSAIRLARGFTKRVRIVKFEGCYHGHTDSLLVAAGSGATTFGVPSSAGVPDELAKNTWVLPYNNVKALEDLFQKQGPNIAAVIVEPICGNMGVVLPKPEFLDALSHMTQRYESLLIFDEVMTGFRVGWSGAQGIYGMQPDLTCLGKIIGGGFPVGALGGRKDVMEKLAPLGPVYQAGTMSGNPIAVSAGLAVLNYLKTNQPYDHLAKITQNLAVFIRKQAEKKGVHIQVNQAGSMFTVFFTSHPVESYFSAQESNTKKYSVFFQALLDRGVYMPPSQFEAAFLSLAHKPAVLAQAKQAFDAALDAVAAS